MPYGVAKEAGGDTPANDAEMESCVKAVTGRGPSKVNAIKICKVRLGFANEAEQAHHERTRPKS